MTAIETLHFEFISFWLSCGAFLFSVLALRYCFIMNKEARIEKRRQMEREINA